MSDLDIPAGIPLADDGTSLIPELAGRLPTHNESVLINGYTITAASSNVKEFSWDWQSRRLHVTFLSGDSGYYEDVPLPIAVGFIETASPGRYVWNVLRVNYRWHSEVKGPRGPGRPRPKPQVVRIVK